MDRFVNNVGAYLIDKKALPQDDLDVFVYGFDLVLFTFISILGLLAFGIVSGYLLETIFYLLAFTPLQTTGGGYHAKTHLRCFLTMTAGWCLAIAMSLMLPLWAIAVFMSQGIIAVFRYSPIEHANAPMSAKQKQKMRNYARGFCVAIFLFALVIYAFHPVLSIATAIGMGMYGVSANVAYRIKMADTSDRKGT